MNKATADEAAPKSPRRKTSKKSRITREELIEGALNALIEDGATGITTRRIAEKAAVPLGTLHYHFETKEALLYSVLDSLGSGLALHLRMGTAGCKTLEDCITRVLEIDWDIVRESLDIQVVQYELTFYALRNKEAAWIAKHQYDDYIKSHADVFALHVPEGTPDGQTKVNRLAKFVMAGIDGIIVQELAAPGTNDVKDITVAAIALAGHLGLLGEEKAASPGI